MPSRASISELPVSDRDAGPYGITVGPDGALWFTLVHSGQIGRLTTDGEVTAYALEPASAGPSVITSGPNGDCWFTEWGANRIGRITGNSTVDEYDLPTPGAEPHGITVDTDGVVWIALEIGAVARLTVAS